MNYALDLLTLFCLYASLAFSLDAVVGHSGRLSLCHASFAALGAYFYTLVIQATGSAVIAISCALVGPVVVSSIIAVPLARLNEHLFVLATLGVQTVTYSFLNNLVTLTGGPFGLKPVPVPSFLANDLTRVQASALLALCLAIGTGVFFRSFLSSPTGRAIRAVRDDAVAAVALGKNPIALRALPFVLSAGAAGAAGVVYAVANGYIDPLMFSLSESLLVLSAVLIGGPGRPVGALLGAGVVVALPEVLRAVDLEASTAANLRLLAYGVMLMFLARYRPGGIAGSYGFER